ncbi:HNH endonuclease [Ralstonia holmesii]|uniref:HNH endonuclease n=1 Tax=Ralstonia holmesii TaxID=3058602 RepID=UPI003D653ECA
MAFKPGNVPWNVGTADFWGKVKKSDGCWIWKGAPKQPEGYGLFTINGRQQYAHRYAWELEHGPIPQGLLVLHRCDTPACVRASHLFLGTHQDNVDDCIQKGRRKYARGEEHHASKLTADVVRAIRNLVACGQSQRSVSTRYGVHVTTVSEIVHRKIWKHVS